MALTYRDVGPAAMDAIQAAPHTSTICEWLPPVVTFLETLKSKTGAKFWLNLALGIVIGLIRAYQREFCS